jgi:hypothetical protein
MLINIELKLKEFGSAKNYIDKFEISNAILEEFYQYCSKQTY